MELGADFVKLSSYPAAKGVSTRGPTVPDRAVNTGEQQSLPDSAQRDAP